MHERELFFCWFLCAAAEHVGGGEGGLKALLYVDYCCCGATLFVTGVCFAPGGLDSCFLMRATNTSETTEFEVHPRASNKPLRSSQKARAKYVTVVLAPCPPLACRGGDQYADARWVCAVVKSTRRRQVCVCRNIETQYPKRCCVAAFIPKQPSTAAQPTHLRRVITLTCRIA